MTGALENGFLSAFILYAQKKLSISFLLNWYGLESVVFHVLRFTVNPITAMALLSRNKGISLLYSGIVRMLE